LERVIPKSVSQRGEFVLSKRSHQPPGKAKPAVSSARQATEVAVRQRPDGSWELVHPRCAVEREDDLREAQTMIDAGENDIARDELRWLLQGCSDNIAAHRLLGEIALLEEDVPLARGHFGYAYQIGMKAIHRAGCPSPFSAEHPSNAPLFAAGKGLVNCLLKLDKRELAAEAVEFLLQCDPRDPLNLCALLAVG
jgi:hypothetical protein